MFDRLEEIRNRYRELNEEILQPETACDYNRYQSCMKEIALMLHGHPLRALGHPLRRIANILRKRNHGS